MVRVVLRWTIGAAILAWAVLVVVAQLSGHPMPWWLGMLPWLVIVVLVVARVVREVSRRDGRTSVRRALTPAGQGLDEVQGIQLGRPPGLVVTYGDDEPPETELVVPRADPLDGRWSIDPAGDVTVAADEPDGQR